MFPDRFFPLAHARAKKIGLARETNLILVGECSAFLASGSDPTDESRMTPDHTTKRSERTGSLHERVD